MKIEQLSDALSVSGQLRPSDIADCRRDGFRSVICNRPDGEAAGQPVFAEIAAEAQKFGMRAYHLPVVAGAIAAADVREFAALLADLPKPILAYCGTGKRASTLWAMTHALSDS